MRKRNICTVIAAFFALTAVVSTSYASDFNAGALVGFSSLSATNGTAADGTNISGIGFGATANYNLDPTWEAGARFTMASKEVNSLKNTISSILGSFKYHFSGDLSPLSVGALVGVGMYKMQSKVGTSTVDTNLTSIAFGAVAGYDYMLGSFSVGPELSYVIMPFSNNGTSKTVSNFNGFVAAKYHF